MTVYLLCYLFNFPRVIFPFFIASFTDADDKPKNIFLYFIVVRLYW